MRVPDFAFEHQDARIALANSTATYLDGLWDGVDPDDIMRSWLTRLPEATVVLSGAQLAAANEAESFVADAAVDEGIFELPEGDVIPRAFAGVASDGRQLASLLAQPAIGALSAIQSGHSVPQSMAMGRTSLALIAQTQVADAGRGADQVAMAGYRQIRGYVRVVQGDACSRCIILAGKEYAWSAGFKRHPHCHCVHLPIARARVAGIKQTPQRLYSLLTQAERKAAGWTLAEQEAIDAGADLFQVTNAKRGMYTAGGRRYTTVGTTRQAIYGGYRIDPDTGELTRLARGARRKPPRMTVDQIFADARGRDEALRMLRTNGYLLERPSVMVVPKELALARPIAAVGADPALKLTVAQLKLIAREAEVPLLGARLKADVVAALRNHEDIHKVKLKGLPEWKAPKPIAPKTIEVPLLGVPAKEPVLSGATHIEWTDHFTLDRANGHFKYVDAHGNTPPEGVRVHNLRVVNTIAGDYMAIDGTAWSFDGVTYLVEHRADQFGSEYVSRALAQLRQAHEQIPAAKRANKSYTALGGENPADGYWRKRFNDPDHISAATASNGHITLYHFQGRIYLNTLRHETGHNLDDLIGRAARGSESPAWAKAASLDMKASAQIKDLSDEVGSGGFGRVEKGRDFPAGVTDYGRSSVTEDFAESVELYQRGVIAQGRLSGAAEKGPIWFRDLYPARAKILDDLFPDLAKAQKAEIAAARAPKPTLKAGVPADLAKLKVPELRLLAKERGVAGYSKLTKPQLLERLGKPAEVPPPDSDLVVAARERQAAIDYARARATLLTEAEHWLDSQGSFESMGAQLRRDAKRLGVEGHKDVAALFRALDSGSETKVRKAIDTIAARQKLTRIESAGDVVPFDRTKHAALGKGVRDGQYVVVVRPGYTFDRNGELIRLHKATVEVATKEEIAAARGTASGSNMLQKGSPDSLARQIDKRAVARADTSAQGRGSGLPYDRNGANGDEQLWEIQERQGFNGRPTIVDRAEMDRLIADEQHIELFRGFRDFDGKKAEYYAEQLRSGSHFAGYGIYGNGTYATDALNKALGMYSERRGSAVVRMAISPGAKMITYRNLERMHSAFRATLKADSLAASVWGDPGRYAAALGFDVIVAPAFRGTEYIILNRTALLIETAA